MNQQSKVAVIGAGVMGEALIAALISSGVKPDLITISEKREDRAQELISKYSIKAASLASNVSDADALLLVVKPQDMAAVLDEVKGTINPKAVVITFAAGKTISFISNGLGTGNPVVRVMPNTPTLIGKGMAGYSLSSGVTAAQKSFVDQLLDATGKSIEIPEELQNALTGTSGSGPAYFFRFVEAMIDGSVALGLSRADATTLTIQTIVGAAALLDESGETPTRLREKVTSLKGATAEALAVFDEAGISEIVAKAMAASARRSGELAQ